MGNDDCRNDGWRDVAPQGDRKLARGAKLPADQLVGTAAERTATELMNELQVSVGTNDKVLSDLQVRLGGAVMNQLRLVGVQPLWGCVNHGAGSLGGIRVSANERTLPILAISTGHGATITSTISDQGCIVRTMRNPAGGTPLYIGGPPSAINRNMQFLADRGNKSGINVGLFVCNRTSCTNYADVVIPIRRF